jgi:antitoxin VapB
MRGVCTIKQIVYPVDISHFIRYKQLMNAPAEFGRKASLFKSNRNQAVRIPKDMEFPEGVKQVYLFKEGQTLTITPVNDFWDDFFGRPGIEIQEPPELPFESREAF